MASARCLDMSIVEEDKHMKNKPTADSLTIPAYWNRGTTAAHTSPVAQFLSFPGRRASAETDQQDHNVKFFSPFSKNSSNHEHVDKNKITAFGKVEIPFPNPTSTPVMCDATNQDMSCCNAGVSFDRINNGSHGAENENCGACSCTKISSHAPQSVEEAFNLFEDTGKILGPGLSTTSCSDQQLVDDGDPLLYPSGILRSSTPAQKIQHSGRTSAFKVETSGPLLSQSIKNSYNPHSSSSSGAARHCSSLLFQDGKQKNTLSSEGTQLLKESDLQPEKALTPECVATLTDNEDCKEVQIIVASGMKLTTIDVRKGACDWRTFTSLTVLSLSHNNLTDVEPLSVLAPTLVDINLNFNDLTDISALFSCKFLQRLSAAHNQIQSIKGIESCTGIKALILFHNCLQGKILQMLDQLSKLPGLRELDVDENPFLQLVVEEKPNSTTVSTCDTISSQSATLSQSSIVDNYGFLQLILQKCPSLKVFGGTAVHLLQTTLSVECSETIFTDEQPDGVTQLNGKLVGKQRSNCCDRSVEICRSLSASPGSVNCKDQTSPAYSEADASPSDSIKAQMGDIEYVERYCSESNGSESRQPAEESKSDTKENTDLRELKTKLRQLTKENRNMYSVLDENEKLRHELKFSASLFPYSRSQTLDMRCQSACSFSFFTDESQTQNRRDVFSKARSETAMPSTIRISSESMDKVKKPTALNKAASAEHSYNSPFDKSHSAGATVFDRDTEERLTNKHRTSDSKTDETQLGSGVNNNQEQRGREDATSEIKMLKWENNLLKKRLSRMVQYVNLLRGDLWKARHDLHCGGKTKNRRDISDDLCAKNCTNSRTNLKTKLPKLGYLPENPCFFESQTTLEEFPSSESKSTSSSKASQSSDEAQQDPQEVHSSGDSDFDEKSIWENLAKLQVSDSHASAICDEYNPANARQGLLLTNENCRRLPDSEVSFGNPQSELLLKNAEVELVKDEQKKNEPLQANSIAVYNAEIKDCDVNDKLGIRRRAELNEERGKAETIPVQQENEEIEDALQVGGMSLKVPSLERACEDQTLRRELRDAERIFSRPTSAATGTSSLSSNRDSFLSQPNLQGEQTLQLSAGPVLHLPSAHVKQVSARPPYSSFQANARVSAARRLATGKSLEDRRSSDTNGARLQAKHSFSTQSSLVQKPTLCDAKSKFNSRFAESRRADGRQQNMRGTPFPKYSNSSKTRSSEQPAHCGATCDNSSRVNKSSKQTCSVPVKEVLARNPTMRGRGNFQLTERSTGAERHKLATISKKGHSSSSSASATVYPTPGGKCTVSTRGITTEAVQTASVAANDLPPLPSG